ncbi:MAG: sensor histidine kinase [Acidobacteriota bacterium]
MSAECPACGAGLRRCLVWNQAVALSFFVMSVWTSSLDWFLLLAVCLTLANAIGLGSHFFFSLAQAAARRGILAPRMSTMMPVAILGAILGMLVGYGLSSLLWGVQISGWRGLFSNLIVVSVAVGGFLSYRSMEQQVRQAKEELRQKELRELELLRLQAQTELRALQSAIEPHFLFNALNSIAALTSEDPNRAEAALLRLSELLRTVVEASRSPTISLEQELSMVRNYLEIERIRFEERLDYRVDASKDLLGLQVPGLLLQPLVENAVKHGVSLKRTPGRVEVTVRKEGRQAVMRVTDDGEGRKTPGSGTGLDNVRRRLRATYGEEACLDLLRADGKTLARVTIPAPR